MRYPLLLILLLIISIRLYTFYTTKSSYKAGQEVILTTTLLIEPQTGKTQRFYIDDILVIAPGFPEYHYGDKLVISGNLENRVINNKRTIQTIYLPKIEKRPTEAGLALTKSVRHKIISVFRNSLPNTEASLLLGIVLGIKDNLDNKLLADLKTSGTLHVIAASGMNVTIVGSFLSSILGLLVRRQLALVLSILGIFFYALLAGFEPSILRASIMGAIGYCALILGRQNLAILSLILTGYFMIIISPKILADIGFQLSFMATLGLILLKPLLDKISISKDINKYQITNDLTTTFSAQLFTLPITLANFGTFSPFSILANTLILWTIPPLMIIGGVGGILGLIIPPLAKIVLLLALPLLLIFEKIIAVSGSLKQLSINNFPIILSIGYYLLLASILIFLKKRNA